MKHIVLASDDRFVQHCSVTIASVLKNNIDVFFHLFTEGLTTDNQKLLHKLVTDLGGYLEICKIQTEDIADFPMPKSGGLHISVATYYRLFVERILPSDIEKVVYMDCDMVVRNNLDDLFSTNLEGYAIGAVFQTLSEASKADHNRLGIPFEEGYFNAGLLIINLKYWREKKVTSRLFEFIKDHSILIKQHDQDVLNAVLYKEVKAISYIWNYLPLFLHNIGMRFPLKTGYSNISQDPVVIHYVSVPKPWEYGCSNPYKSEYYKYLKYTPFIGYKPEFVFIRYYRNVIKPKMMRFISKIDILNLRKLLKNI